MFSNNNNLTHPLESIDLYINVPFKKNFGVKCLIENIFNSKKPFINILSLGNYAFSFIQLRIDEVIGVNFFDKIKKLASHTKINSFEKEKK